MMPFMRSEALGFVRDSLLALRPPGPTPLRWAASLSLLLAVAAAHHLTGRHIKSASKDGVLQKDFA
jgi:hypothetical protein